MEYGTIMISLRSEITKNILNYFYLHDDEELYVNELVRKFSVDKRNLIKKLHELEAEGILKSRAQANLKFYSINRKYPLYKEYEKIILKTVGLEKKIRDILITVKGITGGYIFGSYPEGKMETHSDIDLLVIGHHSSLALQKKITQLQKETDREINVVNMDKKEYQKRINNNDPFLTGILNKKHIKII